MLLKTPTEYLGKRKVDHFIKGKLGSGKFLVEHPDDCECQVIHSVRHAPWVSYDQMHGVLACDHCKAKEDAPCPAVKNKVFSRTVRMNVEAIADQIWRWQLKHENCPAETQSEVSASPGSGLVT
jgi:hypothetical protein